MTHGHKVLAMMQGNSYTQESLLKAIHDKFGTEERFYTCHAENLTAEELIEFFISHGKFMPTGGGFTMNPERVCDHE